MAGGLGSIMLANNRGVRIEWLSSYACHRWRVALSGD